MSNFDLFRIKMHNSENCSMNYESNFILEGISSVIIHVMRLNADKQAALILTDKEGPDTSLVYTYKDRNIENELLKADYFTWKNNTYFVYEDVGYERWQVLNATIHLDEKTPHLHCVVVPLIKKFDKRSNKEKWTISKKHYMKDKNYLSALQDKYHERMINNGYDLDRGIKNSDNEHIDIKQYKKIKEGR